MRNTNPIEKSITNEGFGWFVEWFQEGIDGVEGRPGEPRGARWYGNRAECEARALLKHPKLQTVKYHGQQSYTRNAHVSVGGESE